MTSKNSGSTLAAVMITVTLLSTLLGVVVNVTRTQAVNTNRTLIRAQATSYGDAVLESLFDQWRNAMITSTDETDRYLGRTQEYLASAMTPPTSAQLAPPAGISLTNWSITSVTPMLQPTTRTDGRPTPEQGTKSRLRMRLYYLARVEVAYEGFGTDSTVVLERPFIRGGKNLFDNFFFGTLEETEFHPGAEMYVDGTVYVGGNLYTAHDYLHFLKDVSILGQHTIQYHPADPRSKTTEPTLPKAPSYLDNNWDPDRPPRKGNEEKLFDTPTSELDPKFLNHSIDDNIDSDNPKNPNNDGYRELIEKAEAGEDPLKLDPSTSERLYDNADYRVEVNGENVVTIFKGTETTALSTTSEDYKAIKDSLTLNTALKDQREDKFVRLINMDIGKIKVGSDSGKIIDSVGSGDGLLVYVKDTSLTQSITDQNKRPVIGGTTTKVDPGMRGVKLMNGGSLPKAGLTVATPHTLYIQGDYNSGKTSTSQPASNTTSTYTPPNNKPSPVTTGYDRVPSAVAADAVNILSNAWKDSASTDPSTDARKASNTTVNTAIIAGNVPTSEATDYSGGIENFVRFHENWSGKYFTIYGTLAALYNSQEATTEWKEASYNPPNRRWFYDTNFQDSNPPGFRVARIYERGRWTSR